MEREGPISYSDCVNLTSKYSQNMFICTCISFMQALYMHSISEK